MRPLRTPCGCVATMWSCSSRFCASCRVPPPPPSPVNSSSVVCFGSSIPRRRAVCFPAFASLRPTPSVTPGTNAGHTDLVELLLGCGADPDIKTNDRKPQRPQDVGKDEKTQKLLAEWDRSLTATLRKQRNAEIEKKLMERIQDKCQRDGTSTPCLSGLQPPSRSNTRRVLCLLTTG